MMQNFQIRLDQQDLLAVGGKDSEKFLQGQLTCDLARLDDGQHGFGAVCNNKGRVYANFRILRHHETFILVMPRGVAETAQKQLAKYIPFYKAEITDASTRFQRFGLVGPEARAWLSSQLPALPEPGRMVMLGNSLLLCLGGDGSRFECWTPEGEASPVPGSGLPEADTPALWPWLDMQSGLFFIQPEDIEAYTPEELNLDLAGFVSFDKGCYTGQEIVARMHYRGKAAKRAYRVQGEAAQTVPEGSAATIETASGKILGKVSSLMFIDADFCAYSVLKTPLPDEALYLSAPEGVRLPVTVSLPPYGN